MKTKKSLKISQGSYILLTVEQGVNQGIGVDEEQERQRRRKIAQPKEGTKKHCDLVTHAMLTYLQ